MMSEEAEGENASLDSCWEIGKKNSWDFFAARGGGGSKSTEECAWRVFGGNISSGLGGTFGKKTNGFSSGLTGDRASFASVPGTAIGTE